jgi:hypothetical protein
MFKLTKRTLIVAAAVAAMGAPSSAYAMFISGKGGMAPAPAASVSAPARGGETSGTRGSLADPRARMLGAARHGVSSPNGFQWGDAGIGAAAVLVLISLGYSAAVVIRRRVHQPVAS